jgi:hypothetical protein
MPAPAAPQAIGPVQLDIRAPRTQAELNEEAKWLAERQAKRKELMESLPTDEYWVEVVLMFEEARNKLVEFDIYWDAGAKRFLRRPYVDDMEREVAFNKEAHIIYGTTLFYLTENRPAKKSWFDNFITFICENVTPCKENLEQFREDIASGMSRAEALKRGINRVGLTTATLLIPTRGHQGPIEIGPSRGPSFNVPVPKTGGEGALGKTPVPPRAEPTADPMLMATKPPTKPPTKPAKLTKKIEASKPPAAELDPGEGMTTKKPRKPRGASDDLPKKEKISDRYEKAELFESPELIERLPLPEHRYAYREWLKASHDLPGHPHITPGNVKELDASLQEFSAETGIPIARVP